MGSVFTTKIHEINVRVKDQFARKRERSKKLDKSRNFFLPVARTSDLRFVSLV